TGVEIRQFRFPQRVSAGQRVEGILDYRASGALEVQLQLTSRNQFQQRVIDSSAPVGLERSGEIPIRISSAGLPRGMYALMARLETSGQLLAQASATVVLEYPREIVALYTGSGFVVHGATASIET